MQHEAIPSDRPRGPFDLAAFARSCVLGGILAAADDPSEMKERICRAWQHGHLTAEEAHEWIVRHGLVNA
jgi:hypothetical protein